MIRKFVAIKGIGRFTNCCAQGDLELRKLTVVHADNGRGKTTLGDILRSLQTGDPSYIIGRSSLGTTSNPQVLIRLDGENRTFSNAHWDQTYPNVSIFDDTFVYENVYTGNVIEHEHRKNLYQVFIGSSGVQLARRVEELDEKIREQNREVAARLEVVRRHLPPGITVEQFLDVARDDAVDEKIAAAEADLQVAEGAGEITARAELQPVVLPTLPANFDSLLAQHLEDVQQGAEQRVRGHIAAHNVPGFEQWLNQGMSYAADGGCPFCDQDLSGSDLLAAYRTYFVERYNNFKAELSALRAEVDRAFSEATILRIQQQTTENARLMDFWRGFVSGSLADPNTVALRSAIQAVREATLAAIGQKIAAPLDPVQPPSALDGARALLAEASIRTAEYNGQVQAIDAQIATTKRATLAANPAALKNELARLHATKERHAEPAASACSDYKRERSEKADLDGKKTQAKRDLDTHAEAVFVQYQTRVNQLLDHFGAGFRIGNVKTRYAERSHAGLELDIGIPAHRLVQVELQDTPRLVVVRKPDRVQTRRNLLPAQRHIVRIGYREPVLLEIV